MNNNTPVNNAPTAQAEMNRLRALQIQQQQALAAQQQAARRAGQDSMPAPSAGEPTAEAPIAKDTFVKEGKVGTEAQRQAAYEEFDTDGVEGLSEEEFEAAYDSLMETSAAGNVEDANKRARPKLPMQAGQSDPSYPQQGVSGEQSKEPIRELQKDLSKLTNAEGKPYFEYPGGPTGGYFKTTEAAVKAFQKDRGLPPTGVVDAATYDAIQTARQEQRDVKQAKQKIDGAEITPPSGSADTMERQHAQNAKTVEQAKKALERIPANDPDRAAYEKKVAELEADFKELWPTGEGDASAGAEAKKIINGASITGTRPAGGSPDRIEEMAKRDHDTLTAAQKALEEIPADDPQRAMYEKKVDDLQAAYDTKWWNGEAGEKFRAAQSTIERITSLPPDPATLTANGVCHPTPEAYGKAVQDSIRELQGALAVLPDGDPVKAQLEAKVDQYVEAAAQAQPSDEQLVAHKTSELEAKLAAKAGHPVEIKFEEGAFSPEDQLKQLALLEEALANDSYTSEMWKNFTTIEFNTYENYVNDANPDNLNKYTEVVGGTLKINNPDDDGITAAELDKQRRALAQTLQTGRGS